MKRLFVFWAAFMALSPSLAEEACYAVHQAKSGTAKR